jgi:hypothetical protein
MKNKIVNFKALNILPVAAFLFITNSCRSHDTDNNLNKETLANGISFNLISENFNNEENGIKSVASTSGTHGNKANIINQNFTSGPFDITTELSLEASAIRTSAQASTKSITVADKLGGPANTNAIKYVVVVYKPDGTYLGQEVGDASTPNQKLFGNLNLIGNQAYTFVTYSLGSTTPPPSAPTTNLDIAELNFNGLTGSEADSDLMFAINENVMLSGGNTPLNVHLKHKFTKITISIDNSDAIGTVKGGYPLASENGTGATGIINNFHTDCSIRFKDGAKIGTVTGTSSGTVTANGIKTTGQSFIINTGAVSNYTGTITLPENSIVIGKDTNAQPVVININGSGTGLMPGYAYTLKLKFNSDRYVNESDVTKTGIESDARYAVIAGYKWDRYLLGVSIPNPSSNNPDKIPTDTKLHGNYYQFGRKDYVMTPTSLSSSNSTGNWNGTPATDNAWNSGTESMPIKNITNDPCPTNYRVPTMNEYALLAQATTATSRNISSFNDPSAYNGAIVRISKKNPNIKLTFPIGGFANQASGSFAIPFAPGTVDQHNQWMQIATSSLNTSSYRIYVFGNAGVATVGGSVYTGNSNTNNIPAQKTTGRNIRCIAE